MTTPRAGRHFAPSADDAGETNSFPTLNLSEVQAPEARTAAPAPSPLNPAMAARAQAGGIGGATRGTARADSNAGPVNPLVAARAAGSGRVQGSSSGVRPKATGELYDMGAAQAAAGQSQPMKAFDTSFNDGRNAKRTLLIVLIVVLIVVLLAVGGFFLLRQQARSQATENITAAIQRISDADVVIAPLDEAIGSEISSSTVSQGLTDAMLSSTTASNALTDAAGKADEANAKRVLLSDEQTQVIDAIKASVAARRSMLEIGRTLLASDTKVAKALESLDAAYASISSANDKVRQAREMVVSYSDTAAQGGDLSGFDLWAAVDLDNQAIADVTNAQTSTASAKEDFADADYAALDAYLSARLAELQLILAFDTALANGDGDGANAMIDQINQATAASSQAAASVPGTSRDLVRSAYSVVTSGQSEQYDAARSQCTENDATIRAYLGGDEEDGMAPSLGDGSSSSTSDEGSAADASQPADAGSGTEASTSAPSTPASDTAADTGAAPADATADQNAVPAA